MKISALLEWRYLGISIATGDLAISSWRLQGALSQDKTKQKIYQSLYFSSCILGFATAASQLRTARFGRVGDLTTYAAYGAGSLVRLSDKEDPPLGVVTGSLELALCFMVLCEVDRLKLLAVAGTTRVVGLGTLIWK